MRVLVSCMMIVLFRLLVCVIVCLLEYIVPVVAEAIAADTHALLAGLEGYIFNSLLHLHLISTSDQSYPAFKNPRLSYCNYVAPALKSSMDPILFLSPLPSSALAFLIYSSYTKHLEC
jgi:hypothetical protein